MVGHKAWTAMTSSALERKVHICLSRPAWKNRAFRNNS